MKAFVCVWMQQHSFIRDAAQLCAVSTLLGGLTAPSDRLSARVPLLHTPTQNIHMQTCPKKGGAEY